MYYQCFLVKILSSLWKWTWSSQLKEVIEKEPEEIQAWLGFKPWLLNDWTPCSIHFIYFNSCYFHYQEYYILTMACSPVGFFISMDRALCLVAAKVMVWFLVNPENFQVVFLFLPLSRGIIFSRSIQIVLKKMRFAIFSAFLDYILLLNSLDLLYSNKGQTK